MGVRTKFTIFKRKKLIPIDTKGVVELCVIVNDDQGSVTPNPFSPNLKRGPRVIYTEVW